MNMWMHEKENQVYVCILSFESAIFHEKTKRACKNVDFVEMVERRQVC